MAEWKKVIVSGSNTLLGSINIGAPADGTYTDGLFTDWTSETSLSNAIDNINEVLLGLAPSQAPNLDYIDAGNSNNNFTYNDDYTYKLAFGVSTPTSSYYNVSYSLAGLPNVDFTEDYALIAGSTTATNTSSIRLGVYTASFNIILTLNNDIGENSATYINYPANAFNSSDSNETYWLEVNGGTPISETTSGTDALNGTYFDLTLAQTGSFTGTGLPFALFRHRTGTVTISASLWRTGSNYARVSSSAGYTSYIDWVFDPAAKQGNYPYSFSTPISTSVSATGLKTLSGVKYYTGFSYDFSCSLSNYYKNVYRTTSLAPSNATHGFSGQTTGLTSAADNITTPTTADSILQIQSSHTIGNIRILGTTLTSRVNVSNGLGKTGNSSILATPKILLDKINTANTTLAENFCLENYRASSASYDTQTSAESALNNFPSGSSLGLTELAVYSGSAQYPTQLYNNGNISGSDIVYMPGSQPDYSGATGDRSFYRVFQNGASQRATWNIRLDGANTTFVTVGTSLTSNNMTLEIKVPEETGWRDVVVPAPASTAGIELNDGVGCGSGTTIALNGVGGEISLVGERLGPSEYFILKFTVGPNWSGNISKITISGL